jgi:AraC family L-rhamnose operon transcriptional activator RhaR
MDRLRRRQVFGSDGYPVAGAVIALDAPVDTHTHDFLELAVLLEGRVTYASGPGDHLLEPGAVMAVRPGDWHGYADQHDAVIANLYLGAELLHTELRWLLEVGDLGRFLLRGGLAAQRLDGPGREAVRSRVRELADVHPQPARASAVLAVGLACAALAELGAVRLDQDRRPGFSIPVRRLLLVVGRRPAHPWTMAELASDVGLSVSHLHREFRDQLGVTPMAWLARTRAELAASLLLQTDRPVGWVGAQVGWPDPNYFSRCFRRAYGISPSAYRQRNTAPPTTLTPPDAPVGGRA